MDLNKFAEALTLTEKMNLLRILRPKPFLVPSPNEIKCWRAGFGGRVHNIRAFKERFDCSAKEAMEIVDRFWNLDAKEGKKDHEVKHESC